MSADQNVSSVHHVCDHPHCRGHHEDGSLVQKPHSELHDLLHDLGLEYPEDMAVIRAELRRLEEQLQSAQRVVDAAREVSLIERTGVLPDFAPLAHAIDAYDGSNPASEPEEGA